MFQLAVVSIPVSDPQKVRGFYTDVLGFTVRGEGDQDNDHSWILMMPPSGPAGVTLIKPNARQPAGSAQGLFFQTLDIEVAHRKLSAKGLEISEVKPASWGRFATFADPDGNGFVLAESEGV